MPKFTAVIEIIGVNPYVLLPDKILQSIFKQAGTDKGKIRVDMTIDGHVFKQTLVKYASAWRLYLNMPMRKAAGKDVGDKAKFEVRYDSEPKPVIAMHPKLQQALSENPEEQQIFDSLTSSLQHEIVRYIANLKSEETIAKNVARAIRFLKGEERFVGRNRP